LKKRPVEKRNLPPLAKADQEVLQEAGSVLQTLEMHRRWALHRTIDRVVFSNHPDRDRVIRGFYALVRWYKRSGLAMADKKRAHQLSVAVEYRPLLYLLRAMANRLGERRAQDPDADSEKIVDGVITEFLLREDESGWRLNERKNGEFVPVHDPRRDAAFKGRWHLLNTNERKMRTFIRDSLLEIERVRDDSDCPPELRRQWLGKSNKLKISERVLQWMADRLGSTRDAVRDRLARR
jgi:hypothetical protein